jgi:hypothetical protein
MKRDRGLDLKNKVKALKWNTSFLCLNVIGATYHNGQDTKWSLCLLLGCQLNRRQHHGVRFVRCFFL